MDTLTSAQVFTWAVVSVAAVAWGTLLFFMWERVPWRKLFRSRRKDIAFRGKWSESTNVPFNQTLDVMRAFRKADMLLARVLGVSDLQMFYALRAPITVTGGATGKRYDIYRRHNFPIHAIDDNALMCGTPFDVFRLPHADIALAQALYLTCPETEREFVALCNKTPQ